MHARSIFVDNTISSVCTRMCMYVLERESACVCLRACVRVCVRACVRAWVRACMSVCLCMHVCLHVCACEYQLNLIFPMLQN